MRIGRCKLWLDNLSKTFCVLGLTNLGVYTFTDCDDISNCGECIFCKITSKFTVSSESKYIMNFVKGMRRIKRKVDNEDK